MSVSRLSNTTAAAQTAGLHIIKPTSVVVGSGTGSVADQGAVTFSGATSISLNGCFTANYQNYLIQLNTVAAGTTGCSVRLRKSGTDTSAGYYGSYWYSNYAGSSGGVPQNNTAQFVWGASSPNGASLNMILSDANLASSANNYVKANFQSWFTGGAEQAAGGFNLSANTFDGFTIIGSAYSLTGTIRVFGYNNGGA